jgi:transcriptional regulator with PAS, ATPase and Fis domain
MRQFERYSVQADVSFEILDKKNKMEGLLRDVSLSSGFIECPRNIPLYSWLKVRIASPKQPVIQTMGHVLRLDSGGFSLHFNWLDRAQLRHFGDFLKVHAPGTFLQTTSGHGSSKDNSQSSLLSASGNDSPMEILYRKSWASFIENAPSHYLESMINWSRETFFSKAEVEETATLDRSFFTGKSPAVQEVMKKIRTFAPTNLPILLIGETGSGKEIFSRSIHQMSQFKDGPFVPVNCGAIPDHLAESLFFGHEKGSFSGAHQTQKGYLEAANGGTILLDEIGELPLLLQVKLLRVLQERSFSRVGSHKDIPLQCRIVSATNKNLKEEVLKGTFRQDLYYRLEGVMIPIPPLRERREDLPQLAEFLVRDLSNKLEMVYKPLSASAREAIMKAPWTGNVRELYNSINRAVVIAEHHEILPSDLGLPEPEGAQSSGTRLIHSGNGRTLRELRDDYEKNVLWECMLRNGGNVAKVSEELDISRPSVYNMLKKYQFNPGLF